MIDLKTAMSNLTNGEYDELLKDTYPDPAAARKRVAGLLEAFESRFGSARPIMLLSAPGRTEVGGNHTDHQHGTVLASAIDMDILAVASPCTGSAVTVCSADFPTDTVDLARLEPDEAERGGSASLIRGVAAGFVRRGLTVGGFDAVTSSDVPKGSGLSSSAAFEVLIGTAFSHLFNGGAVEPVTIARIGQQAENEFFGKPCGLMDQLASAQGGLSLIDFTNPESPVIKKLAIDLKMFGYAMCVVNAGGSHADLTDDYAAIPLEMRQVANTMGRNYLGEIERHRFLECLPQLRGKVSDRALLRAMHFFAETERASLEAKALEHVGDGPLDKKADIPAFLRLVRESGASSMALLQNVCPDGNAGERSVSLALGLCGELLRLCDGAARVHGGGFAGTVQAFVPLSRLNRFTRGIEAVFGEGSCYVLSMRERGGCALIK